MNVGQRRRQWTSIQTTLGQSILFSEKNHRKYHVHRNNIYVMTQQTRDNTAFMLAHCLRQWPNNKTALTQHIVFIANHLIKVLQKYIFFKNNNNNNKKKSLFREGKPNEPQTFKYTKYTIQSNNKWTNNINTVIKRRVFTTCIVGYVQVYYHESKCSLT